MISRADAATLVEAQINQFDPDWPTRPKRTVVDSLTVERDWGWVLFYGVPEDFQVGHRGELPSENPPFLVNKRTAELETTGLEKPLQYYLRRYEHRL
jgi:hypothetical protein